MELVAEAASSAEAIQQFKKHRPDVTLMDLKMAGISGIEAIIAIRSDFPNARVIVLTTYLNDMQVVRGAESGRARLRTQGTNRPGPFRDHPRRSRRPEKNPAGGSSLPPDLLRFPAQRPSASKTRTLNDAEREHIVRVLNEAGGVVGGQHGAASRLGLPRTSFDLPIYRMKKLGIKLEGTSASANTVFQHESVGHASPVGNL